MSAPAASMCGHCGIVDENFRSHFKQTFSNYEPGDKQSRGINTHTIVNDYVQFYMGKDLLLFRQWLPK